MWGYRLAEQTGLGPGTVYPILDRLERAGLVQAQWEIPGESGQPRRRFCELTREGRQVAEARGQEDTGTATGPSRQA